jgi:hypothetical protein
MQSSLFLFQYRLYPWEACVNFNFENLALLPNQFLSVCTRDLLGIQTSAPPDHFQVIQDLALGLASALIDVHGYYSYPDLPVLDLSPINFFEVKDSGAKSTVFGYTDPSIAHVPLQSGHADNKPFITAASLVSRTLSTAGLGAAFSDFRSARRNLGPYSAFYAYRVLEDIAYSFSKAKDGKPGWEEMNDTFGTTKNHWKFLTDAGTQARHFDPDPQQARAFKLISGRVAYLNLAKEALDRWLKSLKLNPV